MRVIGGRARGRPLRAPAGRSLRPTADPVREALFNLLGDRVPGSRFLDLYAGTGAVGIEAWSRGAARVVWVERAARNLRCLRQNLAAVGAQGDPGAAVRPGEALAVLRRLQQAGEVFDLVFADPPYAAREERQALLGALAPGAVVAPDGWVILEHPGRDPAPSLPSLAPFRTRRYGDTALALYSPARSTPAGAPY